jgi:hypothetical protein
MEKVFFTVHFISLNEKTQTIKILVIGCPNFIEPTTTCHVPHLLEKKQQQKMHEFAN